MSHVGIFCLLSGYTYPALMTQAQFAATDKTSIRWAKLIDVETGAVVDTHPTLVGAGVATGGVVLTGTAAAVDNSRTTEAAAAPIAREEISLDWSAQNAFMAFAMDSGGQIRAFTQVPDTTDQFGNFMISSVRQAGDLTGCYGVVMIPDQVNALNPRLNLRPAIGLAARDSLVVRPQTIASGSETHHGFAESEYSDSPSEGMAESGPL